LDRDLEGNAIDVAEIDLLGNTPQGSPEKVPAHNGVLWMVWSHWFPATKVFN